SLREDSYIIATTPFYPNPLTPLVKEAAKKVAQRLRDASRVMIISHIDADGISSGSIASYALDHIGIEHEIQFVKKLDEALIKELEKADHELVWFTDLGSGYANLLGNLNIVITDHHVPSEETVPVPEEKPTISSKEGPKTLFDFSETMPKERSKVSNILQVNPHLVGLDGSTDISGAGTAYLVARELSPNLKWLASIAIVGAVGDLQDRKTGKLIGSNIEILEDAIESGAMEAITDIGLYGRETRPLYKLIQYCSEPELKGLTGNYRASMRFLMGLGIDLKSGEKWRSWSDLNRNEQRTLLSALSQYASREELMSEIYLFPNEEPGTPLHEAKEFATLLNSCGRYGKAEVAFEVCKGDRATYLDQALDLQGGHKKYLVQSMKVIEELGVETMDNIQYVHAGDKILDSVIGIVAGMMLGSGKIPKHLPIFAFSEADDGIKVSGRSTDELVAKGIDLSELMSRITEEIGGIGGGHNVAAGATIETGKEDEFLLLADRMVGEMILRARK
ncbi:MAG: DHH family phosphoesterase, partial [Thermoplasmata archaeon]|nr:DHH family phosphoesterase [Thermoplasmata archaeon]